MNKKNCLLILPAVLLAGCGPTNISEEENNAVADKVVNLQNEDERTALASRAADIAFTSAAAATTGFKVEANLKSNEFKVDLDGVAISVENLDFVASLEVANLTSLSEVDAKAEFTFKTGKIGVETEAFSMDLDLQGASIKAYLDNKVVYLDASNTVLKNQVTNTAMNIVKAYLEMVLSESLPSIIRGAFGEFYQNIESEPTFTEDELSAFAKALTGYYFGNNPTTDGMVALFVEQLNNVAKNHTVAGKTPTKVTSSTEGFAELKNGILGGLAEFGLLDAQGNLTNPDDLCGMFISMLIMPSDSSSEQQEEPTTMALSEMLGMVFKKHKISGLLDGITDADFTGVLNQFKNVTDEAKQEFVAEIKAGLNEVVEEEVDKYFTIKINENTKATVVSTDLNIVNEFDEAKEVLKTGTVKAEVKANDAGALVSATANANIETKAGAEPQIKADMSASINLTYGVSSVSFPDFADFVELDLASLA